MNKNVESRVKKDSKKEIKKATANIFNNYMKNDFEHNNNLLIEDNNNNNKRRKVSVTTDLFQDVAFDGDQHFDTSNNVNVVSNVFDEQMHFSSINNNIIFDGHDEYMMMDINNNDEQDENDFNVENDDDQFYISMQKTENEDDAPLQQIENDDEIINQEDDNTWKISMFNELNKMAIKNYDKMVDDLIWNCYDKDLPEDFFSSLNGTETIIPIESNTKGEFAQKLANYFRMINMNILDIAPLFQILNEFFPFANLPMIISNKGNIIPKINDYMHSKIPIIKFDVCINNCIVFSGDYYHSYQCPICFNHRYSPCKRCTSKKLKNDVCSCPNRIAIKTLCYRSIKSIIINLLNYQSFRKLIDYQYFDMQKYFDKSQIHWDIKSSEIYKKNYDEMTKLFDIKYKNSEYKMINIMLSQFFDGCAVFRNKISSFHPLIITILNLPPNYRFKLGVGMFTLSIFSSSSKSMVEDFLFNNLYVEELLNLNNGFDIILEDGTKCFVQVRQIQGIFDTIAAQDKLKIQSSGSISGCGLCNTGKGKIIY